MFTAMLEYNFIFRLLILRRAITRLCAARDDYLYCCRCYYCYHCYYYNDPADRGFSAFSLISA